MKVIDRATIILRATKAKAFFTEEDEAICAAMDKELELLRRQLSSFEQFRRSGESA